MYSFMIIPVFFAIEKLENSLGHDWRSERISLMRIPQPLFLYREESVRGNTLRHGLGGGRSGKQ